MYILKSYFLHDVELSDGEVKKESTNVWAFDFRYFWITAIVLIILYFLQLVLYVKIILLIPILWYGSFTVRQEWKLTLTNKRIIARRIYPAPLNYFFSRIHNFPYVHLEGISTGPRNNVVMFIFGLLIASNLGLNLLKSSLYASTLELPDTLEFILFLALLLPPFRSEGETITQDLQNWYQQFALDFLITAGVICLLIGIALMLISFPWKQFLVLRIRYARDFKLRTSISNSFIRRLSEEFYNDETVKPPIQYQKWHFPWLKDEKIEGVADMEQIMYLTQLIGIFALITGIVRVWIGLRDLDSSSTTNLFFWLLVTLIDWVIIFFSIKYSKRSSEFIITNKRIIFAQEVKQISGVIGRRYFFISDLKRHDIASFEFNRVTAFALEYLFAAIFVTYIALSLLFTSVFLLAIPFLLFSLFLFFFVYQTFVGFSIKTKSGDKWVMRHQLANPATRLRQFLGDDASVFSRLLSNRLEEKKIINVVQKLRSGDVGLPARNFENMIETSITNLKKDDILLSDEFSPKRFHLKRKSIRALRKSKSKIKRKRIQLSLDDILLENEEIVWEKVIPYPLNYKFFTMLVGTFAFLIALFTVFVSSLQFAINVETRDFEVLTVSQGLFTFSLFLSILLYALFQLKYFTLRRKSLVITKKRVFYEEIVRPPKWLFFIGVFRESYIRESLIQQLQVITSGKFRRINRNWHDFKQLFKQSMLQIIIWIGLFYLHLLVASIWSDLPLAGQISKAITFALILVGLAFTWSFSNMFVQLIQSWPTLELSASGIGVDFSLPYLTQSQAEHGQYALWSGIGPKERLGKKIKEKKARKMKKSERN